MANSNGSFGLRPLMKQGSAANSTGTNSYSFYEIANGNTNKIYHGTPVIPLATGFIDVVGAAAGGTVGLLGVFQGCEYVSSTTGKPVFSNYWPGSGADSNHPVKAIINDDPMQLYVVASDATLTNEAGARAAVFANANFSTATTGTDATGVSLGRLAVGTIATTAAPVVFANNACLPTAVLLEAVVLFSKALPPIAVLLAPVVLSNNAA